MTDIEGFLTIYGHSDNLLNNKYIYIYIYIYINLSGYGLAKVIVHKLTFRKTCRNVQAVTYPGFLKGGG